MASLTYSTSPNDSKYGSKPSVDGAKILIDGKVRIICSILLCLQFAVIVNEYIVMTGDSMEWQSRCGHISHYR